MTVISKIAGTAGLVSSLYDIHKTAMIYAHEEHDVASGDKLVAQSIGAQKTKRLSQRDSNNKNWLEQHNFFAGTVETFASIKGYLKGFASGIVRHIPELALSMLALLIKGKDKAGNPSAVGKAMGNVAALGLGVVTVVDFIVNSTNAFERTDYLRRK